MGRRPGGRRRRLQADGEHIYPPGERTAEDLNAYPLHARADVNTADASYWGEQPVSASRSADQVTLLFNPSRLELLQEGTRMNISKLATAAGAALTAALASLTPPLIAGIYALADNAATVQPGYPYAHPRSLFDVSVGTTTLTTTSTMPMTPPAVMTNCASPRGVMTHPRDWAAPDGTGAF